MEKVLTVLLIDDDKKLLQLLAEYLPRYQMAVLQADRPEKGLILIQEKSPDIVVLDVLMPGMNGFETCRAIRKFSDIPIIMLSARGEATDKIVGLELGADDYMSKPFEPRELVSRIQSIIRRSKTSTPDKELVFDDLVVDLLKREVRRAGVDLGLTSMEFELMSLFTKHAGEKLSRDDIMNEIQGFNSAGYSRSIDISISRLRSKLNDDAQNPRYIKSIHGFGYVFIGVSH